MKSKMEFDTRAYIASIYDYAKRDIIKHIINEDKEEEIEKEYQEYKTQRILKERNN
ncbi:hypothetical protein [Campylobacter helveticus]|uniref:hypothetical protein n=1 Tax=Campylobacter helveticus TaxID=28898 RepID=UPI00214A11EE|nr:hypothetical protein [Campylobacter helveticus]MCR2063247.1 hypothetical protein [Campylobacter helveticus]